MSFGKRLQQKRKELGLTQTDLAKILNVSKGAVGNYESELSSPKAEILYKLFDILQCDANFLFQDEMNDMQIEKSPAPAKAETGDARLDQMIECWHDMNEDGKESLHAQVIMHHESARYKKCNDFSKMA